jgi:signal transduction histidine kinase
VSGDRSFHTGTGRRKNLALASAPNTLRGMNRGPAFQQQLGLWGFVLGLWALLVLAFAGHLVFANQAPWLEALRVSLRDWYPWALLAPGVVWLSNRFPLERGRLAVGVPVHLLACMVAVLVCEWLARPLPPGPGPLPGEAQRPFNPPQPYRGPDEPEFPRPPGPQNPPAPRPLPEARRVLLASGAALRAKFNLPIYWAIVCFVHAATHQRRAEERGRQAAELEARLADARLAALRMQLHPHFLFNTLNAISTLVHKDARAADEMIANLSELLRATLDTTAQEIPLRQELDFLARYLEIQQARFGDRLRVEQEIDAAALDGLVPTLILQPIVENAIRHGIEPHARAGTISILARLEGRTLRLIVRDTGGGPAAHQQTSGIGLANTQSRLQALHGSRARLTFNTEADGRFAVQLELPYRPAAA